MNMQKDTNDVLEKKLTPTKNVYSDKERKQLISIYGQDLVDNSLEVYLMLLYPVKNVIDSNGTHVSLDNKTIESIYISTEQRRKKLIEHNLSKLKVNFDDNNFYSIPISVDHKTSVHDMIGFTKDSLILKKIGDDLILFSKAVIIDNNAKHNINSGMWRCVSVQTRDDNSIVEISFVKNPALQQARVLSENVVKNNIVDNIIQHKLLNGAIICSEIDQERENLLNHNIDDLNEDKEYNRVITRIPVNHNFLEQVNFIGDYIMSEVTTKQARVLAEFKKDIKPAKLHEGLKRRLAELDNTEEVEIEEDVDLDKSIQEEVQEINERLDSLDEILENIMSLLEKGAKSE